MSQTTFQKQLYIYILFNSFHDFFHGIACCKKHHLQWGVDSPGANRCHGGWTTGDDSGVAIGYSFHVKNKTTGDRLRRPKNLKCLGAWFWLGMINDIFAPKGRGVYNTTIMTISNHHNTRIILPSGER